MTPRDAMQARSLLSSSVRPSVCPSVCHVRGSRLLKIDRYVLRGVWQALNCVSIHATYCVIVAGASPGETKMWAAVRENGDFFALAVRITGKLLKIDAARQFVSIEFSFHPYNI